MNAALPSFPPATFRERPAPAGLAEESVDQAKPVVSRRIELRPGSPRLPAGQFAWKRDGDVTAVQNPDMEDECQLASNGVYVDNPEGCQDSRVPDLKAGAAEWKRLWQPDTDDTGWMWGDVGTRCFWVRESGAERADFSKVRLVFQCGRGGGHGPRGLSGTTAAMANGRAAYGKITASGLISARGLSCREVRWGRPQSCTPPLPSPNTRSKACTPCMAGKEAGSTG